MILFELQFLLISTYLFYVLALWVFHSRLRKLYFVTVIIFFVASLALRTYVPLTENADFNTYRLYLDGSYTFKWSSILSEPYLPLLYQFANSFFDSDTALYIIYSLNFTISFIFYVWLGARKNVKLWIKIILFSSTYILFTYTVLRNTPAYLLFGVLIYYLLLKRRLYWTYFSFLSHISVFPALLASYLGFSKPTYKQIFIIVVGAAVVSSILSLSIFNHVSAHIDVYTDEDIKKQYGVSLFHKLYVTFFLILNIIIYKYNKIVVFNNFYISILLIYIILYALNPVMAFRFSFYNIMYLTLYPYYKKMKIDKILNIILPILMFIIFYYGFFDSHGNLRALR